MCAARVPESGETRPRRPVAGELTSMDEPLRIMMLSAEVAPYAKTGGLGDVVAALPKALAALGHEVRVFLPYYGPIEKSAYAVQTEIPRLSVPMERWEEPAELKRLDVDGVAIGFVASDRYFKRENIYGYPDDGQRFVFFCRCALEAVKALGWRPHVIHCHDWHTGLVPNWLKTVYRDDPFFKGTSSALTIHNLAFQGLFGWEILEIAGISEHGFIRSMSHPERSEVLDFMARGIIFADKITTVSERYAKEIVTPEYGERLDDFLRERQNDLVGILNGIDTEVQNPATDPNLPFKFDRGSFGLKAKNKEALQRESRLAIDPARPLFGVVSRLTNQKGLDLVMQVTPAMLRLGAQLIVLGVGDPQVEEAFRSLAAQFSDGVAAHITFDPALAQRVYGGADMLLVPSRFEPCGLTQMFAMRYGTVPVVRETGGLADTVNDYSTDSDGGTGFTFRPFEALDLMAAIARAVETYRRPEEWRLLALRCMDQDFSWSRSAAKYEALFRAMATAKSLPAGTAPSR